MNQNDWNQTALSPQNTTENVNALPDRATEQRDDLSMQQNKNQRDFQAEIQELLREYPELKGKQLPDEVIRVALNGKSLLQAYEFYKSGKLQEENSRLQRELAVLRQNHNSTQRAPVRAVSEGENIRYRAEDDFLRGFNE